MGVGAHVHVLWVHDRITLAEAHCKLCLRTTVEEEDALIAVLLCENSITLQHGTTFWGHAVPIQHGELRAIKILCI
jgi:hypothetical protein